jgi:hypothetical protein
MASMSRKHYREFAATIHNAVDALDGLTPVRRAAAVAVIENIADGISYTCKRDNYNFRYDTFFEACGLDAYGKVVK